MTFDTENWCKRVKLAQTDEEMTALAKELSSKPMDMILNERHKSSSTPPHPSLVPEILNTYKGMFVVG
jgi:hypothetical protein